MAQSPELIGKLKNTTASLNSSVAKDEHHFLQTGLGLGLLSASVCREVCRKGNISVKASIVEASAVQTQHQITARHHSNLPDQNQVWTSSKRPKPVELDLHIPPQWDGAGS